MEAPFEEAFEGLESTDKLFVKDAARLLNSTDFVQHVKETMLRNIFSPAQESDEELAARVKEYRGTVALLDSLQDAMQSIGNRE